ncbi:MAG: type II toxin-antitoxin system VapC family toxin, partial [Paracoccaceae bacterium]
DLGVVFAPLTEDISLSAGLLDWSHRDPFDRMIAATALAFDMTLISADTAFDAVPGLRRVWD